MLTAKSATVQRILTVLSAGILENMSSLTELVTLVVILDLLLALILIFVRPVELIVGLVQVLQTLNAPLVSLEAPITCSLTLLACRIVQLLITQMPVKSVSLVSPTA